MTNEIKIINSISNDEFLKIFSTALFSVLSTDLTEKYETINLKMRKGITFLMLKINDDTKIIVSVSKYKIRFRIYDYLHEKYIDYYYYEYKENDPHYDILNKFKKDMVKNLRQFSKIGKAKFEFEPISNYKVYLYNDIIKNYENKYYKSKEKVND